MEAARYFLKLQTDPELCILSEWQPISLSPDPDAQLCVLHVFLPRQSFLFTTGRPVLASECNAQVQGNVFQAIRGAFSTHRERYVFGFELMDMDSSAELEVRLAINPTKTSYLRLLVVQLERVFLEDAVGTFMGYVEKMSMFVAEEIAARERRIAGFSRLEALLISTQEDVSQLREDTGVSLASYLLTLYNNLKGKLKNLANDGRRGELFGFQDKIFKPEE